MALKRKKLDAICAHLKKTSAVDVNATTQNGLDNGDTASTEQDESKDDAKSTTNNNVETVTDLNENPQSLPDPSGEKDSVESLPENGEHCSQDARSIPVPSVGIPSTSTENVVPSTSRAFTPNSQPPSSSQPPNPQSNTPNTQNCGSGRRKSRKAAKPRLVFQAAEQFNSEEEERQGSFNVQPSTSAVLEKETNAFDSSEELHSDSFRESYTSTGFANQYLLQKQQHHNESIGRYNRSPLDSQSSNLSGVPLDLSTSKTMDNMETLSADTPFEDNEDDEAGDTSTRSSTAASSPVPMAVPAIAQVSPMAVSGEAEGLADYATNTMNELLSIYGFGGSSLEGVEKQVAKKQLDLSTLRALAAGVHGQGKILAAPPAHSGRGVGLPVKLQSGQPVQKATSINDHSTSEGISSSSSSQGQVTTGDGQQNKLSGNTTKYKFHNVKPPIKPSSGSTGTLHKVSSSDYNKYIKKFHNGTECGGSHCLDLGYRDHYHCHDCNFKVFIKKEEMVRHYKWHKKRDESLQHGFLRYSPLDDCSIKYSNCTHNKRQTHYHCIQSGCDKVYISTSDVQMHANYHRKDSAIIQEGFQRFRATEDCGTTTCSFYGQRTTHFHCRRPNCNFTFKHKADMEKHKSYHQKDEILGRDGFKKFMKYEHCSYNGCRFSKVSNHIHCIRPGCTYVLHSTAQLYSHKRKHERREFENLYRTFRQAQRPQIQPAAVQVASNSGSQTSSGTSLSAKANPIGSQVNLTSIPLQGYGEPMVAGTVVAGPLLQRMPVPVKLEPRPGAVLAPNLAVASAAAQTQSVVSNPGMTVVQPLAHTTLSSASHTNASVNVIKPEIIQSQSAKQETVQNLSLKPELVPSHTQTLETVQNHILKPETILKDTDKPESSQSQPSKAGIMKIKEEPKSDADSDTDSSSLAKSTSTLTQSFSIASKLEDLKEENLNDSLTLPIPAAHQSSKTESEKVPKPLMIKPKSDVSIGVDNSSSQMVPMLPTRKRERDESWKNYLIRYTANDPCHSRCQLLYKDHYHCKIAGCQVLFRSKDGVREHAKFHDLQDRITPMVYDKYESTEACPQSCQHSQKQTHYHCNWSGCNHIVVEQGQTFARLEHYRIHEYAKVAAGKNYRLQTTAGGNGRVEDLTHRRRGRPPKYPRLNAPTVPKVDLSEQEILESSQGTADGEGTGADEKIINGFRKFDSNDLCPDDRCMYRTQLHYHCGRPRCHTATDRIDVLNLHAKDFHSFVNILENFEFFDRNVNCRRSHCNNNRTNRHYHCTRLRCDYSFVRHSTMTQHEKKHNLHPDGLISSPSSSSSTSSSATTPLSSGTRITPIQLLRRPDGQTYIPIVPAPANLDKNVVKAAGTFYPLSGLPTAVSATPVNMVTSKGQPLTSTLTLTIPANLVTAGIPVMAPIASATAASPSTNIVPVFAGNIVAGTAVSAAPPLTVLLQQKSGSNAPQPSWSAMRNRMHFSLQVSCGRPFCKLKKKDHYHCLECNQAFSDPARLRGHISKHGVRFKKMNQTASNSTPVSVTNVKKQEPAEMGLDLSTGRQKVEAAGKPVDEDRDQSGQDWDDDNDSLSSSLNLSVGKISCLVQGDNPCLDATETNNEGKLIIDEEGNHSENESVTGDGSVNGNEDDDNMSDISFNASSSAASSPSTSRRSGRKRSAPNHSDFVSSDDASLMAKQMKLKLSAPIPSTAPAAPVSRSVPEGFIRFHCSNDCGYTRCAYRQSVTHFHCLRPECGYGFSDKSRILQHRFRHERLDKLMGEEFQQFRATVKCGRGDCEFSEKASHFHCQKCAFVCADSSKVLAHRKYHAKMDNISNNGFQKFGALQACGVLMCSYSRRQTHYHCTHEGCNHAVLGPAQMAPHKLKHASHDV